MWFNDNFHFALCSHSVYLFFVAATVVHPLVLCKVSKFCEAEGQVDSKIIFLLFVFIGNELCMKCWDFHDNPFPSVMRSVLTLNRQWIISFQVHWRLAVCIIFGELPLVWFEAIVKRNEKSIETLFKLDQEEEEEC